MMTVLATAKLAFAKPKPFRLEYNFGDHSLSAVDCSTLASALKHAKKCRTQWRIIEKANLVDITPAGAPAESLWQYDEVVIRTA